MAFKKIAWGDDQKLQVQDYQSLMPFALENKRHEFIREFIEQQDIIESYLNVKELYRLYEKAQYLF